MGAAAAKAVEAGQGKASASFEAELLGLTSNLRAYAMSLARSHDEAEEIVQEALFRALRSRSSFQEGTNLLAWVLRIARNVHYTRASLSRRMVSDPDGEHLGSLACPPAQEWRIRATELAAAMRRLQPNQRRALIRIAIHGQSYEDVACDTGLPVNTVKSHVRRAREALQRMTA